ncbi:hypothetical protein Zmor_019906 [Zophobas morio]|uniref:Uncharacterized protein n=1 Tax=Zophobas morio TaxID=2755281 RepID=A0AA38I1R0_9CUCU|nr:hypothetical protein Zmor_019906 [Zophobas morio]
MKLFVCVAFTLIVAAQVSTSTLNSISASSKQPLQALTDEQKKKLDEVSKECKTESGVAQDLIDKARNGELVDDPKLKSQMLCVAKKANLATAAGEINLDVLKTKLKKVAADDAEVDKLVQKCAVKKDSPEETAFEAFKCLHKEKPAFSVVD